MTDFVLSNETIDAIEAIPFLSLQSAVISEYYSRHKEGYFIYYWQLEFNPHSVQDGKNIYGSYRTVIVTGQPPDEGIINEKEPSELAIEIPFEDNSLYYSNGESSWGNYEIDDAIAQELVKSSFEAIAQIQELIDRDFWVLKRESGS